MKHLLFLSLLAISCSNISGSSSGTVFRVLPEIAAPRMNTNTYHIGFNVFYEGNTTSFRNILRIIRQRSLTQADYTAYKATGNTGQFVIQTEVSLAEYSNNQNAVLTHAENIVTIAKEEGFGTQLLISGHYLPADGWQNINWSGRVWDKAGEYMPFQPCYNRNDSGSVCSMDTICENFHVPVIEHLKSRSLLQYVSVVYLANEPGYSSNNSNYDDATDWSGHSSDWTTWRSKSLVRTLGRCLDVSRTAAAGEVPVGIKLSDLLNWRVGFANANGYDPLEYLIQEEMGPRGDVFGFDPYWTDSNLYATEFYSRLDPFLGNLNKGQLAIAEYGRNCEGSSGNITSGTRTNSNDMLGIIDAWPFSRGFILYAWNSEDCYGLTDLNTNAVYSDAASTALGIWEQIKKVTGSPSPEYVGGPCIACTPSI